MSRVALDSNILIYAELEPESDKGALAQRLISQTAPRGVLAVQSLLEFVAVVRRKRPESLPSAIVKVSAWAAVFETAPTSSLVADKAMKLVRNHNFQVWDAVIWSAVSSAGADVFLSEDLQNGLRLDGMQALNPFATPASELDKALN
jgi:predicted nucleic acid-binding protein